MTDTTPVTHRLKPGSWAYRQFGPLEGTVVTHGDCRYCRRMVTFHTTKGHAFDVYREEMEEVQ